MEEKIIEIISYDGSILEGTFLKAPNQKAAILFVHGITSSRDELNFHSDYAKYMAQKNISSLRFDYRYHGVQESSLENLSLCGIVNDIDSAFNALKENIGQNTDSYFIIGTSFGGGLSAYWADYTNKTEIKKILLNAPVLDYEDDVLKRNGLIEKHTLKIDAQKQLNTLGYVDSSDIHFGRCLINELKYINGIRALQNLGEKVVIFHGDKDEDVPLSSSQKYKVDSTDLRIVPGVGHGFGVEDDEDLDFPETKNIHHNIYAEAYEIIKSLL